MTRHGSLIKLKPEYEERYIILHKYPFPGVLKRIKNSQIRNYSIFLHTNILFSTYEYIGKDFEKDMEKIAQDHITRDWWRLTDPMQEPLETRKPGEWWASIEEVFYFGHEQTISETYQRSAYVGFSPLTLNTKDLSQGLEHQSNIINLTVYQHVQNHYVYMESEKGEPGLSFLQPLLPLERCSEWHIMQEVFHLD